MDGNTIECNTPEEFDKVYNEMKEKDEYWVAWFYGGVDAATGEGWCDDCVKAEPTIGEFRYILLGCQSWEKQDHLIYNVKVVLMRIRS